MTREEVFERLNNVLREVFDDAQLTVTENSVAADVPGWDSLKHIYVLVAIEQEFGVSFDLGETVETQNLGEFADIILRETQ